LNKVVFIYGPTAVGKSGIGIELAKKIDGEIISADSMQIYKGLNIGSAKVTNEEMQGVVHHLLDIKEPNEDYSVANFCEDTNRIIKDIFSRGKTPIVVGGTGLYFKSLINGYDFGGLKRDQHESIKLEELSCEELYDRIKEIKPTEEVDKNNKRRLIRRLTLLKNDKNLSVKNTFTYPYKLFCLVDDRDKIYDRINRRVDKMVNEGLIDEAEYLFKLNNPNCLAMKAIGYKEFLPYFNGEKTLDECKEILKQKTRNYAKRQFTFMNQFNDAIVIKYNGLNETTNLIIKCLEE